MSKIASIRALEILDSRGNPTLAVWVKTTTGIIGKAAVPSGASTGEHEAVELRDGDATRYMGKGVRKAVANVEGALQKAVVGLDILDQKKIDEALLKCDATSNKSRMGANAILGISMAAAKAAALTANQPLYQYLGSDQSVLLPCPLMNIINGGVHADSGLHFQEFMIRPIGASSFREALRWGAEVFQVLKNMLKEKKLSTAVGDEGGFAPSLASHEQALELIIAAIDKAGYRPGSQISLAIDCAASEYYDGAKHCYLGLSAVEYTEYLLKLLHTYPIDCIEDPFDQNDWSAWPAFTAKAGVEVIGDDIFVTNRQFLKRGITEKTANAILIKLNQIGTVSETLATIEMAKQAGFMSVISHRSGETEDTIIADLAVAVSAGQIKTGSVCRGERIAKYNRLLEIEAELGTKARY